MIYYDANYVVTGVTQCRRFHWFGYRQTSYISRTKSQNLNVSRLVL